MDRNIFAAFAKRADDVPFVHFSRAGRQVTLDHGWMRGAAAEVGNALRRTGARQGDVVAIVLDHDPYLYAGFIGAVLAGFVPTLLPPLTPRQDPDIHRDGMRVLFNRVRPAAVITSTQARPAVPETGIPVLDVGDLPQPGHHFPTTRLVPATDTGLAFLQHSSGTTGHKKGVMLTHRQVSEQVALYAAACGTVTGDVVASWLPLYHDMGLITGFLMPAMLGCPVISLDAQEWVARPGMLLDAIEAHGAAFAWLPNFAFHHLIRGDRAPRRDLSRLKALVNCSEPCRAATFHAFQERYGSMGLRPDALRVSYAMAETVFAVTQTREGQAPRPGSSAATEAYLSCGTPLPGVEITLRQADGTEAAEGEPGEICLRHPTLFDGYWRLPEETALRLVDGWYRTRDLGVLEAGELYVIGRVDDLLIVNGRNVMAHEIEDRLSLLPGVVPGRVIVADGFDDALGGNRLIVLAELEPDASETELGNEIRRVMFGACGLLPGMVRFPPRGFLVKSSSGKLSRRASMEKFLQSAG